VNDEDYEKHPFKSIILVVLQMLGMAFAALVVCNMLLEPHSPPVPQCPIRADQ
jgi:L-asparagine transporter-like permease